MARYAIIDGQYVINIVDYDVAPSNPPPGYEAPIFAVQSDAADIGWSYVDGAFVPSPVPPIPPQELLTLCKSQASQLLAETDWTEIPSVTNTANNPHLVNGAEFITYRDALRVLAVYPVENPTWPVKPTTVWSS